MKRYFFTLLAVIMAVCSVPTFAQGYVADYNSIKVENDLVLEDGTRTLIATPFLAHESESVRVTAQVFVLIPKDGAKDTDEWRWCVELQIEYLSLTRSYEGLDTAAPFCKDDTLSLMKGIGGPRFDMKCIRSMTDISGDGRVCGTFQFDEDALNGWLKVYVPDRLYYTQGGTGNGIFPALKFKSMGSFVFPLLTSRNLILGRFVETL